MEGAEEENNRKLIIVSAVPDEGYVAVAETSSCGV